MTNNVFSPQKCKYDKDAVLLTNLKPILVHQNLWDETLSFYQPIKAKLFVVEEVKLCEKRYGFV